MPVFALKKYQPKDNQTPVENEQNSQKEQQEEQQEESKEVTIDVIGSIPEIVINALYKKFGNDAKIEKVEGSVENPDIKVVSSESINTNGLATLKKINENDTVYLYLNRFTTTQESWFMHNLEYKTKNIIFTMERFLNVVRDKLNNNT